MNKKSKTNLNTENVLENKQVKKTEKCKVLSYDFKTKELDIDFKGYGIRIKNVDKVDSDFVIVKYDGEIGNKNFHYEL